MKFSLIIAIYNVEKYLDDCLISVCNQNLSSNEYEIICVNDGSTDQSLKIIEKYQASSTNIKIINQKNKGVSSARNAGLKAAMGEYIWFIDGDDMIAPNCLKQLYEILLKNNLNILCFIYLTIDEAYTYKQLAAPIYMDDKLIDAVEYMPSICQKVFKQDIFITEFYDHLIYGEDDEFVFPLILQNMPIKEYNKVLYYYRQHSESITHKNTYEINQLRIENTLWRIKHFLEQRDFYNQFIDKKQIELIHTYEYNLYAVILINLAKMKPNSKQQISYFNELRALDVYPYPIQWNRIFTKKSFKSYKMKFHQLLAETIRLFLPIKPCFMIFNFFYYFYLSHNDSIGE